MINKKILKLIIGIFLVSSLSFVSAATFTRNVPSSINPDSTFTVTYSTSGATGKWFVAWEEAITGCAPSSYKDFMASETAGDKTITKTFTAPSSGSCTFSGSYQFTNEEKADFPQTTITVMAGCAPNWQCTNWVSCINRQQTRTCTDLNNCNTPNNKPVETQACEIIITLDRQAPLNVNLGDNFKVEISLADLKSKNSVNILQQIYLFLVNLFGGSQVKTYFFIGDKVVNAEIVQDASKFSPPTDIYDANVVGYLIDMQNIPDKVSYYVNANQQGNVNLKGRWVLFGYDGTDTSTVQEGYIAGIDSIGVS